MSWRKYWHTKEFVKTESGRFCVYHGGSRDSKVSLVLLHGAGYSGLTWSTLGENLASLADTRLLALDLRGHGETEVSEEEIDMSGQRMARDVVEVLLGLYTDIDLGVVIMGHSMGGALAAMVAEMMEGLEKGPRLLGLVVEDVVEGTAMEALAYTLAKEERPNGIRVNIVAPGLVDTDMGQRLMNALQGVEDIRTLDDSMPWGRVCQPEDVANGVKFLVSAANSYLTGERLYCDGGGQDIGRS